MEHNPIERACKACGSATKLAGHLNKTPQFISQLAKGARPVPADLCPAIERATGGAVRCEELRPDVDWSVLRTPTKPVPADAGQEVGHG